MGVYSNTAANAYADKIKAVYEYLGEIKKVADRLTPVEDLTSFQAQIQALYDQLDLLVETASIIANATPTGEAILTGSVASIQTLLEIGKLPPDLVYEADLAAAITQLQDQINILLANLETSVDEQDVLLTQLTQFYQTQQTQIDGLSINYDNLATGQASNQANIESALSRLTIQEQNMTLVDERLDSIDQSMANTITGLQGTNSTVAGHTASIENIYNTVTLHTASIDQLSSDLVNTNTNVAAHTSALSEMETTIQGIGDDIVAQSNQTTALKSVIGGSGNLLPNSDFATGANSWAITVAEDDWADTQITVDTFNMPPEVHCLEVLGTPTPLGEIVLESPAVLIEPGQWYVVSGYPCVDNGIIELSYKAFNVAGDVLTQGACPPTFNVTTNPSFSNYTRTWVKFQAPTGSDKLRLYLTVTGDGDFIVQGALFRPMVERGWAEQVGPSAWTPNISGVPEALAEAVQTLETEVANVNGQISAIATAQTDLLARVATAESSLVNEMITSANKDNAFTASINSLGSRLTTAEGSITGNSSAISSLETSVTSINGTVTSHSSQLTNLQAQVDAIDEGTGGAGAAISALDVRVTQNENDIEVHTSQITQLQSSVTVANKVYAQPSPPATTDRPDGDLWFDTDDNNKPYVLSGGSWVARQDLSRNKIFAQVAQPTATTVGDIWIDTDDSNKMYRWNGTTWILLADTRIAANSTAISDLTTRTTAAEGNITSIANRTTTLESTVNNPSTGVSATATAVNSLTTRVSSVEGVNSSQASSITSLSTTVGSHTATISSHTSSINGLQTKWTVTSDVNGYITGLESVNNGTVTEFNIRADKFKISPSSASGARTEFSAGNWRIYDASNVLRVRMGVW